MDLQFLNIVVETSNFFFFFFHCSDGTSELIHVILKVVQLSYFKFSKQSNDE